MVMDLLEKGLEDLFQECRRKFDLKTTLHITVQMIKRIHVVHTKMNKFKKYYDVFERMNQL